MIDTKGFVSVAEAARRLRLSPEQVRRRLRCGQLKGERVGNQWFVDAEEVRAKPKSTEPLVPRELLDDMARLRQDIFRRNPVFTDVVELLREDRESH